MSESRSASEHLHSMGMVCRRTGLKSDRVRAWERRYNVVEPVRSAGNQRLYSDHDIEKLLLLRQATDAGHRIARIARLRVAELRELIEIDGSGRTLPGSRPRPGEAKEARAYVAAALGAIQQLDGALLHAELSAAIDALSPAAVTQQVLVPLIRDVGDLWAEGGLKVAHEHLGTAVLRSFIKELADRNAPADNAPRLLVTTPTGERHELGALLASATATDVGWRVTYLGPDLPAVEIAAAARQRGADAVGLSIVRPVDADHVREELVTLRRHIGETTGIVLGGRAAAEYEGTAGEIGAVIVQDLTGVAPALALFG